LALKIKPPCRASRGKTATRDYCAGAFVAGALVDGISGAAAGGAVGSADCFWQPVTSSPM